MIWLSETNSGAKIANLYRTQINATYLFYTQSDSCRISVCLFDAYSHLLHIKRDGFISEKLARNISFVTTDKVRIANLRCKDVVALGRAPYTNWIGQLQPEDQKRVDEAMQLVGMSGYAEKTMDKMSDGECQRIMIARALAQDTPVILLDEPTAFLDLPNRYELCLLLKKLAQEEKKCVLFSTHDLDIALSLCDSIKRDGFISEKSFYMSAGHHFRSRQRVHLRIIYEHDGVAKR